LLICVFVGWRWGWKQVKEELSNHGKLDNAGIVRLFFGVAKFVTPVLVFVVLLSGLGLIG
jgi:NSS family neurotransmitter:Na+ symporter